MPTSISLLMHIMNTVILILPPVIGQIYNTWSNKHCHHTWIVMSVNILMYYMKVQRLLIDYLILCIQDDTCAIMDTDNAMEKVLLSVVLKFLPFTRVWQSRNSNKKLSVYCVQMNLLQVHMERNIFCIYYMFILSNYLCIYRMS